MQFGRQESLVSGRQTRVGGAAEILVSIGHQPGAVDKLTVAVLKARNLPTTQNGDVAASGNGCLRSSPTGGSSAFNAGAFVPGGPKNWHTFFRAL